MNVTIELAKTNESNAISLLARETFILACADDSDKDELENHIATSLSSKTFNQLINEKNAAVIVAKDGGVLVGYMVLLYSEVSPDVLSEYSSLQLQKLYVAKKYHGTGLAENLINRMKMIASDGGYTHAWLTVFSGNPRAIAFYRKVGFRIVGSTDFHVGNEIQKDHIMAVEIN